MTADEPMSTPDSGGLREGLVATLRPLLGAHADVTANHLLSSAWMERILAAHPEPVPTPDSADDATVGEREGTTPTEDKTPEVGMGWRDGLDSLDALLNDCAQDGKDWQHHVRVSAVRDIVAAIRRFEDDTDEEIRSALWEDAVTEGEAWAMGDER